MQQTGPWCSRQERQAPSPHRQLLMRKACPQRGSSGCAMTGRNRWKGSFRPIHGGAAAATGRQAWRLSAHHRLVLLPSSRSASAFFFAARCSSADESQLVAVHSPSPPRWSPRPLGPLPPLVGRRCRRPPLGNQNQGTSRLPDSNAVQVWMSLSILPSREQTRKCLRRVRDKLAKCEKDGLSPLPTGSSSSVSAVLSAVAGPAAACPACWFLTSACVRLAAGFLLRPRFARFSPSRLSQAQCQQSIRSIECGRRAPWIFGDRHHHERLGAPSCMFHPTGQRWRRPRPRVEL